MSKRNTVHRQTSWWSADDPEPETEKGPLSKLLEGMIAFALACFALKLGIEGIVSVRVPLMVIAAVVLVVFIVYRVYKRSRHNDY